MVLVWDLATGETRTLDPGGAPVVRLDWAADGGLWVKSGRAFRRFDMGGPRPVLAEEFDGRDPVFKGSRLCGFDTERRRFLLQRADALWTYDLDTSETHELRTHAQSVACELGPGGDIALSTDAQRAVRVSRVDGGEAHLLLGHGPCIQAAAISPDGRRVATGGCDATIRVWPMPDLSEPPLHTLPRDELLARLRTHTNVRIVLDPEAPRGWRHELGPFPGWESTPTW